MARSWPARLVMPRRIADSLEAAVHDAPGLEICGLLGGHGEQVTRRYPARNVAAEPGRRFEMDPRAQIAAMRDMRERELDLVAIYHSHPDGSERPSATDLALHAYPGSLCLILPDTGPGPVEPRAWAMTAGGWHEVPVVVTTGSGKPLDPPRPRS